MTPDEIKQAYVVLVKKYDPEVHTDRFMVIQKAFESLKDPEQRAKEDILTFNFVRGDYSYSKEEQVEVPDAKLNQAVQTLESRRNPDGTFPPEIFPKVLTAYLIRARKNVEKKLLKEAMDDWMLVLGLEPTHQRAKTNLLMALIKLGYSYANHTLYDEAIELWDKAATMDPDHHLVIHNLAIACEMAGRHAEADKYWEETLRRWNAMLEKNPDDVYWKNCIIEAHRHQNELVEAKKTEESLEKRKAEQRNNAASGTDTAPGATSESAPPAPKATPPPPRTVAQPSIDRSPKATPSASAPSPAQDELARCREIIKLSPDDFDANMRAGNILLERKNWKEAETHFWEMRKKFPKNVELIHSLGWSQMNSGDVDKALKTWNDGLRIDRKNHAIREALTKAHLLMGRGLRDKSLFINSLVHFKKLTQLMPNSDELHYELGRTYQLKGDINSAYGEYKKVMKLNPKHKEARKGLSELRMTRA